MSVEQPSTKRSKKADAKANASGSTVSAAVDVNDHKHLNASLTLLRTQDDLIALAGLPLDHDLVIDNFKLCAIIRGIVAASEAGSMFDETEPGHANLGGCLKFFAGLDFEEIMSKKASATLTGRMLRNQLYYEFATFAGVKGAGNNVAAPQYIRAACNAALPYGRDDEIPQVHIDAYHASAMPEDDDLARAVAILTADAEEGSDVE